MSTAEHVALWTFIAVGVPIVVMSFRALLRLAGDGFAQARATELAAHPGKARRMIRRYWSAISGVLHVMLAAVTLSPAVSRQPAMLAAAVALQVVIFATLTVGWQRHRAKARVA